MTNKKFIHFATYETFLSKKLSADSENKTYKDWETGEIIEDTPDIPYTSIVFVQDRKLIFTHGELYDATGEANRLKNAINLNGTEIDGSETKNIVTEFWGKSRSFSITDSSVKNTGKIQEVNGGEDIVLRLPTTIDANVTNDSEGNLIKTTYSTKKELKDALSNFTTFKVYSSDTDNDPTLDNLPASSWTTQASRNEHAGDYYITSTGRIFQFYEDPTVSWTWRELTDYHLFKCQESIKDLEARVKALEEKINETV